MEEKQIYTVVLTMWLTSLLLLQSKSESSEIISETQKVTRLRFYLQDFIGGEGCTVWGVTECNLTNILPSEFGKLLVMDDPVTSGPDLDSAEVGRMQGTATLADLRERAPAIALSLLFTTGDFEGSTLCILGRNPLAAEVRELAIVGGTAAFRMATGYIITRTYFSDPARVRSVYEYNAVVYHHVDSSNDDLLLLQ